MKGVLTLSFLLCFQIFCIGQGSNVYDSNDFYYKKTDFNRIDTLDKWAFYINTSYNGNSEDSVKPVGAIVFHRTLPLLDEKYYKVNKKLWTPYLSFEIFLLKDSIFCYKDSKQTRKFSSCVPPITGGDILFVGDFILLNRRVCNTFSVEWTNNIDFAKPVVNAVFFRTPLEKIHTFQDFIKELPIKGDLIE